MKKIIPVLFLGVGIGLVAGSLHGSQRVRELVGLIFSYISYEKLEMSVGLDPLGNPRKPRLIEEFREHLVFPAHYGNLMGVTTVGEQTVLWFTDPDGIVRNAVLGEANRRLYRLEGMEIQKYTNEPAK